MCTHPEAADEAFVHSKGARQFVPSATVPDGFFWSGTQNRGTSEYPFAMWRTGERRFWFCMQRCLIIADSHAKTREDELLLEALLRWDAGEAIVAYSGFVGWYEITREKSES